MIDVDFTDWGECAAGPPDPAVAQINVRIDNTDDPRATTWFINSQKTLKDVWLRNSYGGWDNSCNENWILTPTGRWFDSRKEGCFKNIAVHELGHALGFWHEQDTDHAKCPDPHSLETEPYQDASVHFEDQWDPVSVLNYCSPLASWVPTQSGRWHDYMLSPWDIAGAQSHYGRVANDFLWFSHGNVKDFPYINFPELPEEDYLLFEPRKQSITGAFKGIAADFTHDGRDDIHWFHASGGDVTWRFNANRTYSLGLRPGEDGQPDMGGNYVPLAGDFDGDTYSDIFLYNLGDGDEYAAFGYVSNGLAYFTSVLYSVGSGYTPFTGDFDGDLKTDIFYYKAGDANDYVRWGSSNRAFPLSPDQDVGGTYEPIVGDFDGDGRDDILWYRPGTGSDPLWKGNSNRTFTALNGELAQDGTFKHVVGDFDGNGVDDLFWLTSTNTDRVWLFEGTASFDYVRVNVPVYGQYDYAISGDFDGDDLDDLMFFND